MTRRRKPKPETHFAPGTLVRVRYPRIGKDSGELGTVMSAADISSGHDVIRLYRVKMLVSGDTSLFAPTGLEKVDESDV